MDIRVGSTSRLLNAAAMNMDVQNVFKILLSIILDTHSEEGLMGSYGVLFSILEQSRNIFHSYCTILQSN